jgi:hypothetical protein
MSEIQKREEENPPTPGMAAIEGPGHPRPLLEAP